MTYKKIIRMCNERKDKLESLLEDNTIKINNERKLQLKGAVDEIELFISLLQQYQEQTAAVLPGVESLKGLEDKGIFSKLRSGMFG